MHYQSIINMHINMKSYCVCTQYSIVFELHDLFMHRRIPLSKSTIRVQCVYIYIRYYQPSIIFWLFGYLSNKQVRQMWIIFFHLKQNSFIIFLCCLHYLCLFSFLLEFLLVKKFISKAQNIPAWSFFTNHESISCTLNSRLY